MAGIYLHIPFCKQACHYCNFHFSTSLKYKEDMVAAMLRELELRKSYLGGASVDTIYFGGGTPSLLSRRELDLFFEKIGHLFSIGSDQPNGLSDIEITLEANPDDLTAENIRALKQTPINRLSIGVQSFSEEDLVFMNRAHNSEESHDCIKYAQEAGFNNLTIDLIYGAPSTSDQQWEKNIDTALALNVPHLSCYCLTVEPKTALDHFVRTGKAKPVDEEQAARQFDRLIGKTRDAGYVHYEISNFAKPGFYSRHNSGYWQEKKYLGIGPSAHSFDGSSRQWNIANNAKYLRAVSGENLSFEKEVLSPDERYNEYVMVSLRTMWGCDLDKIKSLGYKKYFLAKAEPYLKEEIIAVADNHYILTEKGRFLADGVAAALFV